MIAWPVVCECGWFDTPSFGNRWFTTKAFPCCPSCGRDIDEAEMVKGRAVGLFRRRVVPFAAHENTND